MRAWYAKNSNMKKKWEIDTAGIYVKDINSKVSYPEHLNDFCFAVEDNSDWFLFRNELIQHYIKKHKLIGDFLDIGGGNGFQVKSLEDSQIIDGQVVLIEPGYYGCLNAKKRNCNLVYSGFFQDLDFTSHDHEISMAGLFDVIEHIEDDIKFLNELYEKLPMHGRVFVNVPAKLDYWSQTDVFAGHYRRYDSYDLERIKNQTSFKVIDSSFYFDFYILPLVLFRIIPEKLGIIKSDLEIISSEKRNLTYTSKSILSRFFRVVHEKRLKKIQKGGRIKNGTSLFFVLEKQSI
jgi:hypothetical protein